jgi:hypothetical protein
VSITPQPSYLNKVVLVDSGYKNSFLLNGDSINGDSTPIKPDNRVLPQLLGEGWRVQSVTGGGTPGNAAVFLVVLVFGPLNAE